MGRSDIRLFRMARTGWSALIVLTAASNTISEISCVLARWYH